MVQQASIPQRPLATKLRPPARAVRHMPRPRLSAELARNESFRVALVSAPAGAGKTTVLSEWRAALAERRRPSAWLSIDDFDNEPRRFLADLIAAVQAARPDFGREALGILSANPDALIEDVAASLVHDFGSVRTGLVLFLDDYHEIRDRTIHALLDYLIRYAPPGIRFAVGTRKDPPLSLERLRVRGEVLEVGWEELRFNGDEARGYLRDVCRLPLTEGQVGGLVRRTEGWIAGLQLAAMAVAGGADADRFVEAFTGAHRNVADYLLESVLGRQPAGLRSFLLRTAILDRMTAPLCDELTGRQDSQQVMDALESANLFIFGLDDHRTWFRYHQLFAEFLRNRLRAEQPEEVAGLYDRASEWFERNGHPTEAVGYAIAGSRFERAARLLETAGRELFRQGEFKALRRWIDALPDGTVRGSPVLCALHAWALGYLGEFGAARARIACAEGAIARAAKGRRAAASPATGAVRAELQVVRAVLGIIRSDEPDVSGVHSGIVSLFPRDEAALRSYAKITLGFASRVAGYLPIALRHFHDALVLSEDANSSLVNLNARRNIGVANWLMGRMNDAEESFRKSLEVSRERLWLRGIGAAFLRCGLAQVLYEKNRLAEALGELAEGIAILEASDAFGFLGMALVDRARTQLALGWTDLALADLSRAREVARRHDVERVSFRADLLEAFMAVQAKDLPRAAGCLDSARAAFGGDDMEARSLYPEKYEYYLVERLRLLLAQGQFGEAVRLSGRALNSASASGRGRNLVEFLVLQAAAWQGLAGADKAAAKLEQAVSLAWREEIVRPFLNAGGGIASLLKDLKGDEPLRAAASRILSAFGEQGFPAGGKAPPGAVEPFHPRELQILSLVSQGLRNREIGNRLFLSEETVKWYLKGLYCKLYVRTRTEAIARARALGLLG